LDYFTSLTVDILKILGSIGGYGIAIILLTIIIRACLWPLNVSQQRSMKKMQLLQPKLKAIQERYKNDPQTMSRKMGEFYKDNKFNPMGGCLPMMVQLPVFILLYTALMSPQFIQVAGDSHFLFIDRLDATLRGKAGVSYDGKFEVAQNNFFEVGKTAKVYLKNSSEPLENIKIQEPRKALKVQGEVVPSQPVDLKMGVDSLNLSFAQLKNVDKATVKVTNKNTREVENVDLKIDSNDNLVASVPTIPIANNLHWDVVILIVFFGLSMFLTQKFMMAMNKNQKMDPMQEQMQKTMGFMMPIMLTATFVFIPIPAGVLLYLIVSNFFQIAQTVIVNKQLEKEDELAKAQKNAPKDAVIDVEPETK